MELNKLRDAIHEIACKHGFHEQELTPKDLKNARISQMIALIHQELSEALEALREDNMAGEHTSQFLRSLGDPQTSPVKEDMIKFYRDYAKDTFEDELADTIIRILDLCGELGIDIETYIKFKMLYNESREYKHGKDF